MTILINAGYRGRDALHLMDGGAHKIYIPKRKRMIGHLSKN